jgi:NADH-quinone oxidoreductase subunit M
MPEASHFFAPLVFTLSCIAVIYTSLVALVQEDMKKLIAYSSIAHMGFVTIGIFALTVQSVDGAIFQMLSHGVVSAALFLCVGVVYDRLHTRSINRYGGLVNNMPVYAALFMLFTMASIGLPGTGGFVGEFLVLLGTYKVSATVTAFAATGAVLGAAYMLYLYKRVVFGPLINPDVKFMKDLNAREVIIFLPLAVLVIWMGVYPSSFLMPIEPAVKKIIAHYNERVSTQEALIVKEEGVKAAENIQPEHSIEMKDKKKSP